jgi:folate-dependent phosphoribosylglycinamide formyltransferase PurN
MASRRWSFMRTVLICHTGDLLNEEGMARWLGSFSDLAAIIAIDEPRSRLWRRLRNEWKRSGPVGLLDVLLFRIYYRARLATADREWEQKVLDRLRKTYSEPRAQVLVTKSPNSPDVEAFLRRIAPDLAIARCKILLKKGISNIPRCGTYVLHPGICPDYRNAHGCFWALARGDNENVGMTLLRIDEGIDTGPVFGHYYCEFDPVGDSHIKIQSKVVIDNFDALREKLIEIANGSAAAKDVSARPSRAWGQPRLSAYVKWKMGA